MGYDTYNAFERNYTGAIATEQARLMKKYGLVDAGYKVYALFHVSGKKLIYKTFILDDYYTEINRSASGELVANREKFPQGM
jgi:alpha-galactosidase